MIKFSFSKDLNLSAEGLVFTVSDKLKLSKETALMDKKLGGAISDIIKFGHFKGKYGELATTLGIADKKTKLIMLVGIGEEKELTTNTITSLGGKIVAALNAAKITKAAVWHDNASDIAHMAYGATLRSYRFDKYRTKEKKEDKPPLTTLDLACAQHKEAKDLYNKLSAIASGIYLARDLVSEPPNVLYPESYAEKCKELSKLGVKVEILGIKEMTKLGMGSLLGVGQGSTKESKLVVMNYSGAAKAKNKAPIAFVGKGVTFDTGGISIKPAAGMEDMKYDMGGSAAVVGVIKSLAERKAKVNAVGIIGLVENMPDGNAQRPSDVVTSMSGQTIEVLNTDAEGRLVLADALWYCQERFKPQAMVNLATLTGAIVMTFGSLYAGLFANDDQLAEALIESGNKVDEKLWRLPLHAGYDKQINSDIADMQNIGNEKGAGSITAAQFLQRFVNKTKWAHLDIAGVAWTKKDHDITPKGATAFGVRLLNQLVEDHYESK